MHAVTLANAHGTALERVLAQAIRKRFADPAPDDRTALNAAYAVAMREARAPIPTTLTSPI